MNSLLCALVAVLAQDLVIKDITIVLINLVHPSHNIVLRRYLLGLQIVQDQRRQSNAFVVSVAQLPFQKVQALVQQGVLALNFLLAHRIELILCEPRLERFHERAVLLSE